MKTQKKLRTERKPELRSGTGSTPDYGVSEIYDGDNL